MGYNTTFKGELKFTQELTASQIAKLSTFLGADAREHREWEGVGDISYIDLVFNKDYTGLKWDEDSEKTYCMVEAVNLIIREMRKQWPDFGLEGSLDAQGEDRDDRWVLVMENGVAVEKEYTPAGAEIQCPHCKQHFVPELKPKKA